MAVSHKHCGSWSPFNWSGILISNLKSHKHPVVVSFLCQSWQVRRLFPGCGAWTEPVQFWISLEIEVTSVMLGQYFSIFRYFRQYSRAGVDFHGNEVLKFLARDQIAGGCLASCAVTGVWGNLCGSPSIEGHRSASTAISPCVWALRLVISLFPTGKVKISYYFLRIKNEIHNFDLH